VDLRTEDEANEQGGNVLVVIKMIATKIKKCQGGSNVTYFPIVLKKSFSAGLPVTKF
jgi:hypothetical protein